MISQSLFCALEYRFLIRLLRLQARGLSLGFYALPEKQKVGRIHMNDLLCTC